MNMENKKTVLSGLKEFIEGGDVSALDRYWGEPYVQHNPGIADGVSSLKPLVTMTTAWKTYRAFAEGEWVVTHSRAEGWGPKPMIVFDVFLLRGGKMVEHWDIMQAEEEKTLSGRTQVDGPAEAVDLEKTADNKKLVRDFYDDVIYGHKMDKLTDYISTEMYHQHNPGVGDGLAGFGEAMKKMAEAGLTMEFKKTYRFIAEGNFVFAHSEGEFAGRHVAFADLFRVENGKIVEHWDVIQDVVPAEKSANKNGMFEQVTKDA